MDYTQLFNLKDQVAIITGGHCWLGYDMACVLASAGCNIIIAARNYEKSAKACEKIKEEYGVDTLPIAVDHCNYEQVEQMAKTAFEWKGRINILINNAGGGSGVGEGDFFKRSPELIQDVITGNLVGPMFVSRAVGPYMVKSGKGKIINLGSIAGMCGRDRRMYRNNDKMEQSVDYAAAKAGVIGMTRDLAAYMAPYDIQVNSISPGGFDKNELPEGFVRDYSYETIKGRMGAFGSDMYGTALFLASSASDYVTGQNIPVDGGFSILK